MIGLVGTALKGARLAQQIAGIFGRRERPSYQCNQKLRFLTAREAGRWVVTYWLDVPTWSGQRAWAETFLLRLRDTLDTGLDRQAALDDLMETSDALAGRVEVSAPDHSVDGERLFEKFCEQAVERYDWTLRGGQWFRDPSGSLVNVLERVDDPVGTLVYDAMRIRNAIGDATLPGDTTYKGRIVYPAYATCNPLVVLLYDTAQTFDLLSAGESFLLYMYDPSREEIRRLSGDAFRNFVFVR